MSTAKFDTLSNLAGTQSVPVATVAQGVARAWVNFNGTGTVAIRASFNVSSITDGGTGLYAINFTTAMPDANYASPIGFGDASSSARQTQLNTGTRTTTSCGIVGLDAGGAVFNDISMVTVAIFR
jgi:hypothetical protein